MSKLPPRNAENRYAPKNMLNTLNKPKWQYIYIDLIPNRVY